MSLQFLYSLLQVYIVHRVSFIFHLNVFLVSVCTRGFGYLLCWPRGRGIGLVCTRRFSFHEFYNFLLFNFLIFISFCKTFFYPRHLPTPTSTTHTHDPRPLPTTHDPRHLATLVCYVSRSKVNRTERSCLTGVEGLNVINDPKCNKVLNVITFCPKCNKLLSWKLP